MRVFARLLLASILTLGLFAAGASTGLAQEGGNLIVFDSMTPVTGAAVGVPHHPGINGGGPPLALTTGTRTLRPKGARRGTVAGPVIPPPGGHPAAGLQV